MHLLNYAWYDLYALFVFLRNHPERYSAYEDGIRRILALVDEPLRETAPANVIRHCLRPCFDPADTYMHYVTVDNEYTCDILFVTNDAYYALLSAMLRELLKHGREPDRLSALCDALHNIPSIILRYPRPRNHIRFEISPYQEQYNPDFLKAELKLLR